MAAVFNGVTLVLIALYFYDSCINGRCPQNVELDNSKETNESIDDVFGIHGLHVWSMHSLSKWLLTGN